jgi:hypothetical protein
MYALGLFTSARYPWVAAGSSVRHAPGIRHPWVRVVVAVAPVRMRVLLLAHVGIVAGTPPHPRADRSVPARAPEGRRQAARMAPLAVR